MRLALTILLLCLPLPLAAVVAGALADHLGRELGASAARLSRQLSVRHAEPLSVTLAPLAPRSVPERAPSPAKVAVRGLARPAPAPPSKGVFVRAEAVIRLANRGARPSGVFVSAAGERPAGLALIGVGGLGVGLVDGDILTHAGGRPARSAGDVVGMVIASRGARAPQISGRFWRAGEYYDLVVEQPYLGGSRGRDAADGPRASVAALTRPSGG